MLITRKLAEALPPIDHFSNTNADSIPVAVRFVGSRNTYYPWEYDPKHKRFYGLVKGSETHVGFFTLRSMEGGFAQSDKTWKPKTLSELAEVLGMAWIKIRR